MASMPTDLSNRGSSVGERLTILAMPAVQGQMWLKQGATAAVWIAACYISVSLFVALPAFSQTSEPLVPVPPPPERPTGPGRARGNPPTRVKVWHCGPASK